MVHFALFFFYSGISSAVLTQGVLLGAAAECMILSAGVDNEPPSVCEHDAAQCSPERQSSLSDSEQPSQLTDAQPSPVNPQARCSHTHPHPQQQRQQQEKEGHRDRPEELLQEVTESESEHCGHAILPVTSQRYVCPEDLDASPADSLEGSPVHCSPSGRDDDKSRKSEPEDLVARFENDFAQHLKKRNRHKKLQFGAAGAALASGSTAAAAGVGVVVGGAVVVAASPLLLPGLAVAAVCGGAGGVVMAQKRVKMSMKRHKAAACDERDLGDDDGMPTLRRLNYLVKWGHWQLLQSEGASLELRSLVLDEVALPFSPWVQRLYLLRARGRATVSEPQAREVFQHLAPLYFFLQHRAAVDAVLELVQAVNVAIDHRAMDLRCLDRCRVGFPTILETISFLDRQTAETHAKLMRNRSSRHRKVVHDLRAPLRKRLQRIVEAICGVLSRPDLDEALSAREEHDADDLCTNSTSNSVSLVVPPEGAEHEFAIDENEYYSASEGSEENEDTISRRSSFSLPGGQMPSQSFDLRRETLRDGNDAHCWREIPSSSFDTRSVSYFTNRVKRPAGEAMFQMLNMDLVLVGASGPVWRAATHKDFCATYCRQKGDKRFLMVQNWIFPPYQAVFTAAVDPSAPWFSPSADSPQARVWQRFLAMEPDQQRDVFKVVMSVEEGPWLVRRATPKKPVLIGRKVKMSTHYEPGDHIEVVVDVSSGRAEKTATGIVLRGLNGLQLHVASMIEARNDDELPESLLFAFAVTFLDPSRVCCPSG